MRTQLNAGRAKPPICVKFLVFCAAAGAAKLGEGFLVQTPRRRRTASCAAGRLRDGSIADPKTSLSHDNTGEASGCPLRRASIGAPAYSQ